MVRLYFGAFTEKKASSYYQTICLLFLCPTFLLSLLQLSFHWSLFQEALKCFPILKSGRITRTRGIFNILFCSLKHAHAKRRMLQLTWSHAESTGSGASGSVCCCNTRKDVSWRHSCPCHKSTNLIFSHTRKSGQKMSSEELWVTNSHTNFIVDWPEFYAVLPHLSRHSFETS